MQFLVLRKNNHSDYKNSKAVSLKQPFFYFKCRSLGKIFIDCIRNQRLTAEIISAKGKKVLEKIRSLMEMH
ncbi:hypothetical protein DRF67_04210 [Chryseobacterium pennipullorum]|uniref:Uncharacterized protein n=1 Tax=Chryseobacterium pennipullorum TaxID=2258963 RepID=A0A3D9B8G8_9FLAO|nr:hypothetical protein DRF67_04210 [Chryseobacterium pennipullorum]